MFVWLDPYEAYFLSDIRWRHFQHRTSVPVFSDLDLRKTFGSFDRLAHSGSHWIKCEIHNNFQLLGAFIETCIIMYTMYPKILNESCGVCAFSADIHCELKLGAVPTCSNTALKLSIGNNKRILLTVMSEALCLSGVLQHPESIRDFKKKTTGSRLLILLL